MKFFLHNIFQALVNWPSAKLGLPNKTSATAKNRPMINVPAFCAICDHCTPPQPLIFSLDGPPAGYCGHPAYSKGNYPREEVIDKL